MYVEGFGFLFRGFLEGNNFGMVEIFEFSFIILLLVCEDTFFLNVNGKGLGFRAAT
jgi:hypothetical protein